MPQDKVAMVRSYIDRPLLGMSLLALVPFVSAVCYRLLDPVLINTAPRKERRAWVRAQPPHRGTTLVMPWLSPVCVCLVGDQSIIFVLGLRSAGACLPPPTHTAKPAHVSHPSPRLSPAGTAHSLTVSVAAIKGLFARSEPLVSTEPQAPLVRYYR